MDTVLPPKGPKNKDPRRDRSLKKKKTLPPKKRQKRQGDITKIPSGLRKDTTTSAYGDAGKGRPDPFFKPTYGEGKPKGMKEGGYCKGAGAAIKGTNFKGVF